MPPTIDPRDRELARRLLTYSVRAQKGNMVYIHCVGDDTLGLGAALVEEAGRLGAGPYLAFSDPAIDRAFLLSADEGSIQRLGKYETTLMENTDCYIGIRGADNIFESADVPSEKMGWYMKHVRQPAHLDVRVRKTRWVVLRYPNASMAQLSQQSTASFADFYYRVCLVDYAKMDKAVQPLADLMRRTDRIHIKGTGTDLTLSIKDIGVVPCTGEHNIPDGECFTAPVRDSMNGVIQFNTPTSESGFGYENICLRFEKGKVVEASAANPEQTRRLNEVLDRDEGARYIGELAIGFNPMVLHPMRDTLFDEKIAGSLHMALGQCYEQAENGNRSSLHWDIVLIQRPDYGGGEIWFDDVLIRKDGLFVLDELRGLNPDAFQS
jgi:aminopeptidase